MRGARREETQQARRGHRDGELRDREGPRRVRRPDLPRRPRRRRRIGRLPRRTAGTLPRAHRRTGRPGRCAQAPPADLRRAVGTGDRDGDGPRAAVHLLAVALADTGRTGGGLGRLALPSGRVDEPAPRCGDHGHADLGGHPGRVRVVALCTVLGHCRHSGDDAPVRTDHRPHRRQRQHLPRSRRRGDDVHPGRSLLRGARQTAGRRGPARAAGDGRPRGHRPQRRCGATHPGRAAADRRRVRGTSGREDRHRRRGGGRHVRSRRVDAHGGIGSRGGATGRSGGRCDGERRRPAGGARRARRRRHPAGPDGPPGRGRTER